MPRLEDLTIQQIIDALRAGNLTWAEAVPALTARFKVESGLTDAQIPQALDQVKQQLTQAQPGGPLTPGEAGYLAEEPRAAWNRAFNLPSVGANPFQAWLGGQMGPAYAAYAGQNLYNQMTGAPGGSFGNYLGAADLTAAPGRALSTLRNVRGQPEAQQMNWLGQLGGEDVGADLGQMFQAALQGRGYAGPFARAGARRIPGYQQQWETETLGGSRQADRGTLLAYLMRQFGL